MLFVWARNKKKRLYNSWHCIRQIFINMHCFNVKKKYRVSIWLRLLDFSKFSWSYSAISSLWAWRNVIQQVIRKCKQWQVHTGKVEWLGSYDVLTPYTEACNNNKVMYYLIKYCYEQLKLFPLLLGLEKVTPHPMSKHCNAHIYTIFTSQ